MTDAIEDIKKSTRGRPKADTRPIMVRVTLGEMESLDEWIASNGPPYVSRPEAIRRLIQKGLKAAQQD
ncbi:MAG: CopG family transcriptional regulator [Gluconobacter sp.]|uniref:CopG family transcriptional regulator n=1 Tax=Gluconobacter sp. TaxID=1876758 RepID=UPI0039ED8240